MYNFKKSVAAIAVAASLGAAAPALANQGAIVGASVNESGAVLSNVAVTIKNAETGLTRSVVSDGSGQFRFPLLPPGKYNVEASKTGYNTTTQQNVVVGLSGKTSLNLALVSQTAERIEVRGTAVALVDVTSSQTGIVVDAVTMNKVPVPRDLTGVALLAPGTTKGDSAFGNLPSIGGASVAENAYYVNGLNLTNFRTGVGSSEPPFEMYESFEVKTGGYSAEFGRVTGGVINAETKSGSNEFKWGANFFLEPDSLRADKPNSQHPTTALKRIDNSNDEFNGWDANFWASGAIVEDTLFFYVLYNPRKEEQDWRLDETQYNREFDGASFVNQPIRNSVDDDSFWGVKFDWYITENNILELTAFSDKSRTVTTSQDPDPRQDLGDDENGNKIYNPNYGNLQAPTIGYADAGGLNYTLKYTGVFTDWLSVSAQYGVNETDRTVQSALDANPAVYHFRDSTQTFHKAGNFANFSIQNGDDQRKVFRLDADLYLGDHEIRFGIDSEKLTAKANTINSGGAYYLYYIDDVTDPANPSIREVRHRHYEAGGSFDSKNFAYYIQDQWQVTDNFVLNLGLRNDSFENFNGIGDSFVKLSNQWAPRVGAVYDLTGDGESKIWASYGRYYLPVAANTNIRLAGAETYIQRYYEFNGYVDSELEIPVLQGEPHRVQTFSDGDAPDPGAIVDASIDPMFSDEFILGYQFQLNDEWSLAVQATYRKLGTTIEDVAIDKGFDDYLKVINPDGPGCTECSGFHYYVLTNPGSNITVTTDPDGAPVFDSNGNPVMHDDGYQLGTWYNGDGTYNIPAEYLRYPESIRKYMSWDITAEKAWDDVWMLKAAYTWAHSWGNNEGYVRSDNGQDDAGLTTNFDQPGLLDGGYGKLPNDRRHAFKVFGSYQITDALNVGLNFSVQSGRPKNKFGYHPTDEFAQLYGSESFYAQGELTPRGSVGTTGVVTQLDLSTSYTFDLGRAGELMLRADIFNLLNSDSVTEVHEIYDNENDHGESVDVFYGSPTNWQTPRYVRLSVSYRF